MLKFALLLIGLTCALGEYQYFEQDGHGGYDYGYDAHLSQKHESGDHSGHVHGSFSYVDGDGHHQSAHYHADPHSGFQIHASNLPVAPVDHGHLTYAGGYGHESHDYKYHGPPAPLKHDGTVDYTPEVKKARAEHFAALAAHKNGYAQYVHPHYTHGYQDYSHHHSEPITYAGYYHHYHGPPAPLKHDGTVDDLPEVKAARAAHLAEFHKVLYRHKRNVFGAPLKHDGTVDETPEVKQAKAVHFAALAQARSYNPQPYLAPQYFNHVQRYHGPPAPLNHDGTVAETPEVKQAKAAHYAAYQEQMAKMTALPHFFGQTRNIDYPSQDFSPRYHGPPAPLNHDGTVAETPEVQHAKAVHFQMFTKFLQRHKRSPIAVYEQAPLHPDGTVDETPEVKQAKAAFMAAHAAESALADRSWVETQYDEVPIHNQNFGFSKPEFEGGFVPSHQIFSQHFSPIHHSFNTQSFQPHSFSSSPSFSKSFESAPLNHDGTVADTPEIKAAKAVHFAAHQDALTRIASTKHHSKPFFNF